MGLKKNAPPPLRIFRPEDAAVYQPDKDIGMLLIEPGKPWEFRKGFLVGLAVGLLLVGYILK